MTTYAADCCFVGSACSLWVHSPFCTFYNWMCCWVLFSGFSHVSCFVDFALYLSAKSCSLPLLCFSFQLFNTTHKRGSACIVKIGRNVFYADWLACYTCCDSLPGKYKYCLGNTSNTILVLAVILYCGAFEAMTSRATKICNLRSNTINHGC